MGVAVAYSVLAVLFLALAAGAYTPKRWRDLEVKQVRLLKFGCLFGFVLLALNIVSRLGSLL